MRWLPTAVCTLLLLSLVSSRAAGAAADAPLPSRVLDLPEATIPTMEPASLDLIDLRAAEHARPPTPTAETTPHSIFGIKRHVGVAVGYDNGVLHGSLGMYLTVVEWGRWNYGIPSPALGFGRYQKYDPIRQQVFTPDESTLFISLASVHYRVGYITSLGMNWYVNLEQIFDLRSNMTGSQV